MDSVLSSWAEKALGFVPKDKRQENAFEKWVFFEFLSWKLYVQYIVKVKLEMRTLSLWFLQVDVRPAVVQVGAPDAMRQVVGGGVSHPGQPQAGGGQQGEESRREDDGRGRDQCQ